MFASSGYSFSRKPWLFLFRKCFLPQVCCCECKLVISVNPILTHFCISFYVELSKHFSSEISRVANAVVCTLALGKGRVALWWWALHCWEWGQAQKLPAGSVLLSKSGGNTEVRWVWMSKWEVVLGSRNFGTAVKSRSCCLQQESEPCSFASASVRFWRGFLQ